MDPAACGDVVRLSTDELDARERDALVRDFYGRICMRLDLAPLDERPLSISAATTVLPGVTLSRGNVAPMSWSRSADLLADGSDMLAVSWMEGGYRLEEAGRTATYTAPGAACLMRLDRRWRAEAPGGGRTYCLQLPRSALAALVGDPDDLPADAMRPDSAEGRLLLDYVAAVTRAPLHPHLRATVSQHVVDLLAVALGATGDGRHAAMRRGVRAARLRAVKQHVRERLHDPRLSAETAARHLNLSSRYIRRLFAEEGRSFGDYVTEQRLSVVRRRLADPLLRGRSVADLAFEAGLVEPSTFYRQFKARYGVRPTELRAYLRQTATELGPQVKDEVRV